MKRAQVLKFIERLLTKLFQVLHGKGKGGTTPYLPNHGDALKSLLLFEKAQEQLKVTLEALILADVVKPAFMKVLVEINWFGGTIHVVDYILLRLISNFRGRQWKQNSTLTSSA